MEAVIDALAEVRRERLVRQSVYPRLVTNGKLTQTEADRRLYALKWAEAYLHRLVQHWAEVDEIMNQHPGAAAPQCK